MNSETKELNEDQMAAGRSCRHWGRKKFLIPFFIVGMLLIKGALGMALWNALVPELFHGPTLTFLQTLGLMILVKLFGTGGFRRPGHFGHFGGRGRWMHLSPEEKEKMRAEFERRFR